MFRALTAGSTLADAVRRPTRLDELISACGGDEAGVRAVVDAFRAPGVNFLVPEFDPHNPKLALDTYIDISHESLIRQWKKLSEWLGAEGRAAQQWRRLVDRFGTGEMLRGRELANLVAWRSRDQAERGLGEALRRRLPGGHRLSRQEPARAEHQARGGDRLHRRGLRAGRRASESTRPCSATPSAGKAAELKERLAETEAERERAQAAKKQVLDLLENVIFNIAVPLTSSDRARRRRWSARRASETAQTADARGTDRTNSGTQGPGVDEQQDDRRPHHRIRRNGTAPEPGPRHRDHGGGGDAAAGQVRSRRYRARAGSWSSASTSFGEAKLQAKEFDAAEQSSRKASRCVRAMLRDAVGRCDVCGRTTSPSALGGVARVHMRRDNACRCAPVFRGGDRGRTRARRRPSARPPAYNLQIHLGELGDIYVRLGDRSEALKAFEERLQVRRRRLAAMPGDSQRLTDVSVALDRVGQLIRDKAIPTGSRKYFEEALKIDRALYQRSSTRRDWQENLVFSLTRVGDLERQLGRQREALAPYEEALGLQRKLASDSSVIAPQQTLASLLGRSATSSAA